MPAMRRLLTVVALAACGDGVMLPDASIQIDGQERGRVTVRVIGPSSGFETVYFQNADSTIALATRTNEAGEAAALMAAGGFVTVVDNNGVYTWTGVVPGDELELDLSFATFDGDFPNVSVRIEPMESAEQYYLFSRCESFREVSAAIETSIMPFFDPCSTTTDLVLVAMFNSQGIGYRTAQNVALNGGGTVDMRGPYEPFVTSVEVIGPADEFITVRQKLANNLFTADTSALVGANSRVVVPTRMAVVPGLTLQTTVYAFGGALPKKDGENVVSTSLGSYVWGPSTSSTQVDLTTAAPRNLTSRPTFDLTSYTLDWSESGGGDAGDAVWVRMGFGSFTWTVIGKHTDETLLRLPVLPHPDLRPVQETFFLGGFAVLAMAGGYDRLRSYLLGHWSPSDGVYWPMHEAAGRVNFRSLN
jgi:hypothetical protein